MTAVPQQQAAMPWLTIIGVGADGLVGLPPAARALVANAEILAGGERHLAMAESAAMRIALQSPLPEAIDRVATQRGRRVVVLASGDPLHYGIAATLRRRFATEEMTIIPHHSAFTLACARLAWPRQDVATATIHGRPLELLHRYIHPGAKLLVLCEDGTSPAKIAALLNARGFGPSLMTALEHLGAEDEHVIAASAERWSIPHTRDLVTLAIECRPGPNPVLYPITPGLPDDAFEHDGQITKREVRAVTLSTLAPRPGQLLWDVGAGAGSIAIEWLRAAPGMRTIAIERDPVRADRIARNALTLGVPELQIVRGEAPAALKDLPRPDVIFLGGGVAASGLIDACWQALSPGGKLVANAVTAPSAAALAQHRDRHGGSLTRIAISRAEGDGWRDLRPITQLCSVKG